MLRIGNGLLPIRIPHSLLTEDIYFHVKKGFGFGAGFGENNADPSGYENVQHCGQKLYYKSESKVSFE